MGSGLAAAPFGDGRGQLTRYRPARLDCIARRSPCRPGARYIALRTAAVISALFGLLTIAGGGNAIFGSGAAGVNYVAFVLWFNFLAGFAYLAAAPGLWRGRRRSARLALWLALLTLAVFAGFGVYVAAGGLFEARTVWAMAARSALWGGIATLAYWALNDPSRGARAHG